MKSELIIGMINQGDYSLILGVATCMLFILLDRQFKFTEFRGSKRVNYQA